MRTTTPRRTSWLAYACSLAMACVALAACGADGGGASTGAGGGVSTSTGSGASAPGFPVTIQNCGRTLTFDKPPSRVVLPYHPIAEMFVGLGLADRAIGRVGFRGGGGLTEPPLLAEQAADFAAIPVISPDVYPPSKEEMLALRPDFFLAYGDFDYDPADGKASIDDLAAVGTQTYSVICPPEQGGGHATEKLDDVYRSLLDLGTIFGVSDRAEQRVEQMQQQVADVRAKLAGTSRVKVLFYHGGTGPLIVAGGVGIYAQLLDIAGADNVFADQTTNTAQLSLEGVAATNPDVFIVLGNYEEPTAELDVTAEQRFLFETFPNMTATKDRRVIATDYAYTSPGWRSAQTAEDLARQLHPDAFG
ncbi:MAG: ABC transporter substrate-binding protein [Pseudonocardiaceae bacterium]